MYQNYEILNLETTTLEAKPFYVQSGGQQETTLYLRFAWAYI